MPKRAAKPTIAVDIDEVLLPHFEDLMNWYNRKYGTYLTLANNHPADDDIRPWAVDHMFTARQRVHAFFQTPEFLKAKPFDEAIKVLRQLSKKFRLVVITGRDHMVEQFTKDWLDEHFPKLFAETHFTARYSVEGRGRSKAEACQKAKADYFIDDSLEAIQEVAPTGIKVLLFGNYPWNQLGKLPKNVIRVGDWPAVKEYFDAKS